MESTIRRKKENSWDTISFTFHICLSNVKKKITILSLLKQYPKGYFPTCLMSSTSLSKHVEVLTKPIRVKLR